jgi:hypothetical protein
VWERKQQNGIQETRQEEGGELDCVADI